MYDPPEAPEVTGTCPESEILEGNDIMLECSATGMWETAVWLVRF